MTLLTYMVVNVCNDIAANIHITYNDINTTNALYFHCHYIQYTILNVSTEILVYSL